MYQISDIIGMLMLGTMACCWQDAQSAVGNLFEQNILNSDGEEGIAVAVDDRYGICDVAKLIEVAGLCVEPPMLDR